MHEMFECGDHKNHLECTKLKHLSLSPFQSKPSFQEVYVFGLWWIDELSKDSKADNPDFLDILTQRWFKKVQYIQKFTFEHNKLGHYRCSSHY